MPDSLTSASRAADPGVRNGRLQSCPRKPNCVCSDDSDESHRVEALSLAKPAADAWKAAQAAVLGLPRTRVVTLRADYLHAECRSALLGFVDDLELQLREIEGIIAVRSASRLGYSDLGVNRKRVEALRTKLRAIGAVR